MEKPIRPKVYSLFLALVCLLTLYCGTAAPDTEPLRSFESSFESVSDFAGFYIVPQGDYDSNHELSTEIVHDGAYSHKAWITAARAANNDGSGIDYRPHRAYPTIQFQKTPGGVFLTPCLVTIWVYLDISLIDRPVGSIDDWFSFVTLTPDPSDNWARTVLVNIAPDGYARLVHVPRQGEQIYSYQAGPANDPSGALRFPYRQWVRFDVYIDFDSTNGYAKVWQDGILISHANVEGGAGALAQAHFGLYASAAIPSGTIYNDDLRIREVVDEAEALTLVNSPPEALPLHRWPLLLVVIGLIASVGTAAKIRTGLRTGTTERMGK